jgi:hypothetical protein
MTHAPGTASTITNTITLDVLRETVPILQVVDVMGKSEQKQRLSHFGHFSDALHPGPHCLKIVSCAAYPRSIGPSESLFWPVHTILIFVG